MGHEIQRLNARHNAMVDLAVAGHTTSNIAEIVGMTKEGAGLVVNSPLFQHELARRRSQRRGQADTQFSNELLEVEKEINGLAKEAVGVHADLIRNAADLKLRQTSATTILEMAFRKRDMAGKNGNVAVHISTESLENLRIALQEDSDGNSTILVGVGAMKEEDRALMTMNSEPDLIEEPGSELSE